MKFIVSILLSFLSLLFWYSFFILLEKIGWVWQRAGDMGFPDIGVFILFLTICPIIYYLILSIFENNIRNYFLLIFFILSSSICLINFNLSLPFSLLLDKTFKWTEDTNTYTQVILYKYPYPNESYLDKVDINDLKWVTRSEYEEYGKKYNTQKYFWIANQRDWLKLEESRLSNITYPNNIPINLPVNTPELCYLRINIPFVNKESSIITHNTYNHANQVSEMNNCNEKLALIKASIKIKNKN